MSETFRVFWQPGCSSCLKAKEFLASHGIPYDSVNVLDGDEGMAALQALGARSVPVVSKGREFVFAQNLSDLAAFVGVEREARTLSTADLAGKVERVLEVATAHAQQLPDGALATSLPGRDRTYRDLAYHIFVITEAFLESARGGTLTFEFFERRPPETIKSGEDIAKCGSGIAGDFHAWWRDLSNSRAFPNMLKTYYGEQSLDDLLERTAWHMAQHTRQLETVIEAQGVSLSDRLSEADLSGLPLPDHVYDDEVPLDSDSQPPAS